MADEAVIKVRLDTKQARAELRDLSRQAAGTAPSVGGRSGGGFQSFAGGMMGGMVGSAIRSATGPSGGLPGVTGLIGEGVSPLIERFRPFNESQIESGARSQAFQQLPFRRMGAATSQEEQDRIAKEALGPFRFRTMRNAEVLRGQNRFGARSEFHGPVAEGIDRAPEAVKEVWDDINHSLKGIWRDIGKAWDKMFGGKK